MQPRPRQYEAFISFKHSGRGGGLTPDAEAAREVYEALVAAGVRTFFSPESLKRHGDGRYAKTIEAALESAKFLVLVASCRELVRESGPVDPQAKKSIPCTHAGAARTLAHVHNQLPRV